MRSKVARLSGRSSLSVRNIPEALFRSTGIAFYLDSADVTLNDIDFNNIVFEALRGYEGEKKVDNLWPDKSG